MTKTSGTVAAEDKHRLARERVAAGLWIVDAEAGTVHSGFPGKQYGKRLGYLTSNGYVDLALSDQGRKRRIGLHRVIWESVHGAMPTDVRNYQLNHINGVTTDNRIANLECVTASENVLHAHRTGLAHALRGSDHPGSKVTAEAVAAIRARYAAGEFQRDLAAEFGLNRGYVSLLIRGERWSSVGYVETVQQRAARRYPVPEHGTVARYRKNALGRWDACRCDLCRAASTEYARTLRSKKAAA